MTWDYLGTPGTDCTVRPLSRWSELIRKWVSEREVDQRGDHMTRQGHRQDEQAAYPFQARRCSKLNGL
jgi:hypothetical protein